MAFAVHKAVTPAALVVAAHNSQVTASYHPWRIETFAEDVGCCSGQTLLVVGRGLEVDLGMGRAFQGPSTADPHDSSWGAGWSMRTGDVSGRVGSLRDHARRELAVG